MLTRRQLTVAVRRSAILDAALTEFNEHGVAAASIEEIRRSSGASVGSIYHHFSSKAGIAASLYLGGLREYQNGFVDQLEAAVSTRAGVEHGVRHHVEWIVRHRELARFLLLGRDPGVVAETERPLRELNRAFFGAVSDWMAPAVTRGELRELPSELLRALWLGPSQELARMWLADRTRTGPMEAIPVLAAAAWNSLSRARARADGVAELLG
jgi:AcrR family transcriptional regulator